LGDHLFSEKTSVEVNSTGIPPQVFGER